MRTCKWILTAVVGTTLCAHADAAVRVVEYNGYVEGEDYDVSGVSEITIVLPSLPDLPYDFDCYDDDTDPPYAPAAIESITVMAGIGTVELMVRGHEGREFGASDLWLLQLDQEVGHAGLGECVGHPSIVKAVGFAELEPGKDHAIGIPFLD